MQDQQRLLRLDEAMRMTGLRRSVLFYLVKQGQFPAPIKITTRSVAWVESEVANWIQNRIAAARGANQEEVHNA